MGIGGFAEPEQVRPLESVSNQYFHDPAASLHMDTTLADLWSGSQPRRSSAFPSTLASGARHYISQCGMDERMASRPRAGREPAHTILPMQLRIGDRFTSIDGEWKIVGGPLTLHGGNTVKARVSRTGDPRNVKHMGWPAHTKITVRRSTSRGTHWADLRRALLIAVFACSQLVLGAPRELRSK